MKTLTFDSGNSLNLLNCLFSSESCILITRAKLAFPFISLNDMFRILWKRRKKNHAHLRHAKSRRKQSPALETPSHVCPRSCGGSWAPQWKAGRKCLAQQISRAGKGNTEVSCTHYKFLPCRPFLFQKNALKNPRRPEIKCMLVGSKHTHWFAPKV